MVPVHVAGDHEVSAFDISNYVVVKLEDVDKLRSEWSLDVTPDGRIIDRGPTDTYSLDDARGFAGALLTAANLAEERIRKADQ